jgi:hypothetical protein
MELLEIALLDAERLVSGMWLKVTIKNQIPGILQVLFVHFEKALNG